METGIPFVVTHTHSNDHQTHARCWQLPGFSRDGVNGCSRLPQAGNLLTSYAIDGASTLALTSLWGLWGDNNESMQHVSLSLWPLSQLC